ncbi:MAG: hypothetical protein ACR2MD_01880 [Aridibacter sp.]
MNSKNVTKNYKKNYPEIANQIYRKSYSHTENYHDYNLLLNDYASLLILMESNQIPKNVDIQEKAVSYNIAKKNDFPIFFVSKLLLNAVMQTNVDFEIDPIDFYLPFESFYLVMPKNSIKFNNDFVAGFEIFRTRKGEQHTFTGNRQIKCGNGGLFIKIKTLRSGEFCTSQVKNFIPSEIASNRDLSDKRPDLIPLDTSESVFISQMVSTVFNILFAMQCKPELIERGERISINQKIKTQIWSPNVIGRKYQTKTDPNELKGTHSSPQTHWRRGHFRRQAFGRELSKIKTIWIEPMLINAGI